MGFSPAGEDTAAESSTIPDGVEGGSGSAAAALRPAGPAGPLGPSGPDSGEGNRLGTAKVGKLLLEFSIPAIISMIFNALYNVVDSVFLGQALGSVGIAVTTLAMPVQIVLMGFSMLAGQGGNALAAIQLGQGDSHKVEKTVGNTAFTLTAIAVVVFALAMIFMNPLLALIGTTPELMDQTRIFVTIICAGFVFQSLGMGMNNFLRTAGEPNRALYTMMLGTGACIVFNYLFVMVMGMGVAGSALATVTGQFIGMVPVLWFFIFSKKALFRLRLSCMRPEIHLIGRICLFGLASFVTEVVGSLLSIVLNQLLVYYGTMDPIGAQGALSAIGVGNKIAMFSFMPIIGLVMGAQPIIGFNYGAKSWKRVKEAVKLAMIWATVFCAFFYVVNNVFAVQLIGLFGIESTLTDYAVAVLRIMMGVFPIVGIQVVGSSYFQSSGQPIKSTVLELTRQVLFLMPLFLILPNVLPALVGITQLDSIVVAWPASDMLSTIVTVVFVIREMHKLTRLQREAKQGSAQESTVA